MIMFLVETTKDLSEKFLLFPLNEEILNKLIEEINIKKINFL
jgi:hypothetical protein